jgi:hypothetical protein
VSTKGSLEKFEPVERIALMKGSETLVGKQRKWLEHIALASKPSAGMYRGARHDFVPYRVAAQLERLELIYLETPHNPAHKDRWVITSEGIETLKAASLSKEREGA